MSQATLETLPVDIWFLVLPLLEVEDFLSLCRVNKKFYIAFSEVPEFWREVTTKTFRLPAHPLLRANGPRWKWLYRNLRNSRVYEWGGPSHSSTRTWPTEASVPSEIGNIVDIQCGGWSTSCLTSNGELYLAGRIDGTIYDGAGSQGYKRLLFDSEYPATSSNTYQKSTAIKQFSSGRRHILALSDDGMIWSWFHKDKAARRVEFDCPEMILNPHNASDARRVVRVVAGWDINSAFVIGVGIIYWKLSSPQSLDDGSGPLIVQSEIIPGTDFIRVRSGGDQLDSPDVEQGEVIKHVVLEDCIVFITDTNKVYAMQTDSKAVKELPNFSAPGRKLQDIQGSFRNFAVFTSEGEVILGNKDFINEVFIRANDSTTDLPSPLFPAGLQHSDVISISFGDYHYTALHSNGKISSYGREPRGCGALGLGSDLGGVPLRSLTMGHEYHNYGDVTFFPYAADTRHNVWFEPEKRDWLGHLVNKTGSQTDRLSWYSSLRQNRNGLMEKYSACVESQGDNWDDFEDIKALDPDGLGAYFALSVASAGWQSVSLVLVNKDLADAVRRKHIVDFKPEETSRSQRPSGSGETATMYKWERQTYPPLLVDASGNVDSNSYQFDTWPYGLPPFQATSSQEPTS